ncbi:hypothetical protein ANN_04709 [Periplaneta americana]|uniref:Uncharacterized protein n=1 Tax=Periplaneta americana TaxID=6978 RepID=A0ABQ8TAR8_PERAM|nr:hypothetical protein ANN_04709 [Periplaneta americana]
MKKWKTRNRQVSQEPSECLKCQSCLNRNVAKYIELSPPTFADNANQPRSLHWILKADLKFHPHKLQVVHELRPIDWQVIIAFCAQLQEMIAETTIFCLICL